MFICFSVLNTVIGFIELGVVDASEIESERKIDERKRIQRIAKQVLTALEYTHSLRPLWTGKSDGGSAILAAEAIRHKPNHSVTVKLFSFNEEQLATLQGIKCFQTRRRMEKLFIHNAKAVSEGWCQYASLPTIGSILQCVICKASYNCGTTTTHSKTVAGGISWCRAERKCPGAEIHNG